MSEKKKRSFWSGEVGTNLLRTVKSPFALIMSLVVWIICLSYVALLLFALLTSLKDLNNFADDLFGIPKKFMFENYQVAFTRMFYTAKLPEGGTRNVMFPELLMNSLLYSTFPVLISVFSHAMVAYVAAKYDYRFNKVLHFIVVFVMVVPLVSSLGASINLMKSIGFYDSYAAYLYGTIKFADSNFLIWYAIFRNIPKDYNDAAALDGAGHWRIMLTIIFPMALSMFMITFVLEFVGAWNSYINQLTTMPSMPNLALVLRQLQEDSNSAVSRPPIQMAAAMIVAFPCLLIYCIGQKWMIGNFTVGGIKG